MTLHWIYVIKRYCFFPNTCILILSKVNTIVCLGPTAFIMHPHPLPCLPFVVSLVACLPLCVCPTLCHAVSLQHLWNITMVQLVSLMYRDQQQGTIRKLINEWLESSLPESSEDDENNPMSSSSSVSSDIPVWVLCRHFPVSLLQY